jgi:hypothetical protein
LAIQQRSLSISRTPATRSLISSGGGPGLETAYDSILFYLL